MASKGIEVSIIENNIEVALLTNLLNVEIASEPTIEITLDDGAVVEVSLKENAPIYTEILQKVIESSEVTSKPVNVTFQAIDVLIPNKLGVVSTPESGGMKITNLYVSAEGKLVIVYET